MLNNLRPSFEPVRESQLNSGFQEITVKFVFLTLAILLLIVWICAFLVFHIITSLIHLLLAFAIIFFIVHLVTRAKHA